MARADLLVRLVQTYMRDDKTEFKKTVEEIIAEERHQQHRVLAERLEAALKTTPRSGNYVNKGMLLEQRASGLFQEVTPQRTFSDLILSEEVQSICQEIVQEQHRADLLRSYGLEPRNRILLIGPPGNGKTSLAEAFAHALMLPLFIIRYESIVGTYLGETANRLKKLFEYAITCRCVLFFDEFETLGKERGDMHETGEIKRVVSSLLLQIDALPSYVVVIGATNHAELLDSAVWRRFQVRMMLPRPSHADITQWFKHFEERINISLGYSHDALAKHFSGASFAEIEEFGKTVFRQYILGLPNTNIKKIVSRNLQTWSTRSVTATCSKTLEK